MINRIKYLRISLLNSCNLNCFYCRPPQQENDTFVTKNFKNYQNSIKLLHSLGVEKIRFTGGEPTLYKQLPELIKFVKKTDSDIHTAMTSNAILLRKKAKVLADAGLDSVNISIDTLDENRFCSVTGRNKYNDMLDGIIEATKHIPKVKLNTVLIRGTNDDETDNLIQFANKLKIDIRFIEFMPTKLKSENSDQYISGDEIKKSLPYQFTPITNDPSTAARYVTSPDLDIKVGFINPVSHSFCAMCNRIRLTSDGRLYGCLFSGASFNLFDSLQQGYDYASKEVHQLVANKTYTGCSRKTGDSAFFPSFINMGG